MTVYRVFILLSLHFIFGVPAVSTTGEPKVVCYFINWASSRYQPEHVDPHLCTHIMYAFAILDPETLTIKSGNENVDIGSRFYERIVALREQNPQLSISIALGGWSDSEHSEKYSMMISNATNRANFINDTIAFLDRHGFNGLDLDWEFPVCWWQNCSKGPASDKEDFAQLTQEIREAFDKHDPPLLLTAAISAVKPVIDDSYNIERLNRWLHFFNVMAYDFHSDTDGSRTIHHSAFYHTNESLKEYLNADFVMHYLVEKGASKSKLVMGIPAYGRSYRLLDPEQHSLGSPTADKTTGYVPYNQICQKVSTYNWTVVRDLQGPYTYNGTEWVGYDDPRSAALKGQYVKDNEFGGVMTWELTMDDYETVCCKVKYPLIKSMIYGLSGRFPPDELGCD